MLSLSCDPELQAEISPDYVSCQVRGVPGVINDGQVVSSFLAQVKYPFFALQLHRRVFDPLVRPSKDILVVLDSQIQDSKLMKDSAKIVLKLFFVLAMLAIAIEESHSLSKVVVPIVALSLHGTMRESHSQTKADKRIILPEIVRAKIVNCKRQSLQNPCKYAVSRTDSRLVALAGSHSMAI